MTSDLQGTTFSLFVANLSFILKDEDLGMIFSDRGFFPTSSRIVRNSSGRSTGFGFVEFDTEAQQIAARDALNNLVNDSRPIIVQIAHPVVSTVN